MKMGINTGIEIPRNYRDLPREDLVALVEKLDREIAQLTAKYRQVAA